MSCYYTDAILMLRFKININSCFRRTSIHTFAHIIIRGTAYDINQTMCLQQVSTYICYEYHIRRALYIVFNLIAFVVWVCMPMHGTTSYIIIHYSYFIHFPMLSWIFSFLRNAPDRLTFRFNIMHPRYIYKQI